MTSATRWSAQEYAANTAHHRRFDASFRDGWSLPPAARVLDIGCGVGDFTVQLAGEDRSVLGIDRSADLIARARERFGDRVRFEVADAESLIGVAEGSIDIAVSRSALHWVSAADHPRVLSEVARVLAPAGLLRAEFGAAGQLPDVLRILDSELARFGVQHSPWYFASPQEYAKWLASAGLTIVSGWLRVVPQRRLFTDAELTGWLTSQVVIGYESVMDKGDYQSWRARVLERCADELPRDGQHVAVEFRRLDLLARPS